MNHRYPFFFHSFMNDEQSTDQPPLCELTTRYLRRLLQYCCRIRVTAPTLALASQQALGRRDNAGQSAAVLWKPKSPSVSAQR
jgi:hypothetical protein